METPTVTDPFSYALTAYQEEQGQRARADRATRRRIERRTLDQDAHDAYCRAQYDTWTERADWALAEANMLRFAKRLDALAEHREALSQAQWWAQRIGRCHDERLPRKPDSWFESDSAMPDPEIIDFDGLDEQVRRRLVNMVSDARNWAYEPTDEVRLVPSMITYERRANGERYVKGFTEAKLRQIRSKPGHHIIGGADDLVSGRQAIVTVWSQPSQQWVLYHCFEGDPKNGFTQWLPYGYVRVPRPPETSDLDALVSRASLDDHSDRCAVTLELALQWAYEWAQQLREQQAAFNPEDVLARGDWTNFEWASEHARY